MNIHLDIPLLSQPHLPDDFIMSQEQSGSQGDKRD